MDLIYDDNVCKRLHMLFAKIDMPEDLGYPDSFTVPMMPLPLTIRPAVL